MKSELDIYRSIDFGDFIAFYDAQFLPADEMGPAGWSAALCGIRFSDGIEVTNSLEWNVNHTDFISWSAIEDDINEKLNK